MGNNHEIKQEEQLSFYSQTHDAFLGKCDIYTSNKFSNCYIAKVTTVLYDSSQFQLFSKIQDQQNIYLVSLYGYKFGKNCNCDKNNTITTSATSFWEYLTISLLDVIKRHSYHKNPFHESEIWYILKACVQGYKAFEKLHVAFDFQPSKMMINQDGRIRLNWMHIKEKNVHTCFYLKLKKDGIELNEEEYFSPEQLLGISHKQFSHKLNAEKTNVFSLGMTLLYCMGLREPVRHYYRQNSLLYEKINEIMNHVSGTYSDCLLKLVGSMLNENPVYRPSFGYIIERYEGMMKRDDQIKMIQKQGKDRKKSVTYQRMSPPKD